jgi:hypothetical protein
VATQHGFFDHANSAYGYYWNEPPSTSQEALEANPELMAQMERAVSDPDSRVRIPRQRDPHLQVAPAAGSFFPSSSWPDEPAKLVILFVNDDVITFTAVPMNQIHQLEAAVQAGHGCVKLPIPEGSAGDMAERFGPVGVETRINAAHVLSFAWGPQKEDTDA